MLAVEYTDLSSGLGQGIGVGEGGGGDQGRGESGREELAQSCAGLAVLVTIFDI